MTGRTLARFPVQPDEPPPCPSPLPNPHTCYSDTAPPGPTCTWPNTPHVWVLHGLPRVAEVTHNPGEPEVHDRRAEAQVSEVPTPWGVSTPILSNPNKPQGRGATAPLRSGPVVARREGRTGDYTTPPPSTRPRLLNLTSGRGAPPPRRRRRGGGGRAGSGGGGRPADCGAALRSPRPRDGDCVGRERS